MRINEKYQRSPEFQAYLDYIVSEQKKVNIKRPPSTEQAPSMKAIMERDPKMDAMHSKRPYDLSKIICDGVNERPLPVDQMLHYEAIRRRPKNGLGASELGATTQEKRDRAAAAFEFTPPAPLSDLKIKELTKIEPIKEFKEIKHEWRTLTPWEAFKHWVKGGKIKKEGIK